MAEFSLEGDRSGLPKTTRSGIPYEIKAVSPGPKESWGAGNGSTSIECRVLWENSAQWIRDMVGDVGVIKPGSTLLLKRNIPETVQFGDERPQWCTLIDQIDQGGNPSEGANFSQAGSNWPQVAWCRYRAVFEVVPYDILNDADVAEIEAGAGAYAGAIELYRYVVRTRRTTSREQPIPAASTAGGFKVVDDATPANRKPVGQIGFRVIEMADVTYKWVRVPVNWPPPIGYTGGTVENPWPPVFNPVALDTTKLRARDKFIGSINDNWFDAASPNGYAFAPGTLLFVGYDDSNRYYDAAGDWVCDITYNFKFKGGVDASGNAGGWNYFLDANGNWKLVSLNGLSTGTKPYTTNDFNKLFKYAAS